MLIRPKKVMFSDFTEGRCNNFDFLRFLFAALVVFSHSFVFVPSNSKDPLLWLTGDQVHFGALSVNCFFAISGFLITASWLRSRSVWSFAQKRILRIYPGFIVACLVSALVVGALGATNPTTYFRDFPWAGFFVDVAQLNKIENLPPTFMEVRGHAHHQVNGSLWTIKIEFECYILAALIGLAGGFRRRQMTLLLFAVVFVLYLWLRTPFLMSLIPQIGKFAGVSQHLRFVSYFLVGSLFFLYRDRIPYRRAGIGVALALIALGIAGSRLYVVLPLCASYLLFYAAFAPWGRVQHWDRRADLSYGVYLYAWPIQLLLAHYFGAHLTPYTLALAALPLSCAAAFASWHLIERPALLLKWKEKGNKPAAGVGTADGQTAPLAAPTPPIGA